MLYNWTLAEIEMLLRQAELDRGPGRARPVPPTTPGSWRSRPARGLVDLGLHLDAEATRAAMRSMETAPRLNGSDA